MTLNQNNTQTWYLHKSIYMLLVLQLASCAFAPWQAGQVKGQVSPEQVVEAKKNVEKQPEDTVARKDLLVTRELAINRLLEEAEHAKANKSYDDANALYDKVLQFLPEDQTAMQGKAEINRNYLQQEKINQAIEFKEKNNTQEAKQLVHDILLEEPKNQEAQLLKKGIDGQKSKVRSEPPQLKPPFEKPVTLELREAEIKVVFEALSRATGINFILDKDIKAGTKATIFIKKARIEDAINMVLSSNGLQKKALSENTALVFPATQQKLKDYQELMIRSFYFSNASAKQVGAMLKSMLKTKDIYIDERLNMLVMRDTPEVIRIAEKLVAANDMADPEVMLDIEVLEVSRNRLQELGIVYPNQLSVVTPSTLTLASLRALTDENYTITSSPSLRFKKTSGEVNLLSNPRIRVKNNEKAKILVGDKVPIITSTATANVGTAESVQYIDVGLKLDVEPRITLDDFVNIKVALEVSSLGEKTVTNSGSTVYTIGTRNATTVLRLKDGETQILAGLIQDDERKTANKLPALGDIPLIGRLFSNQEDKKTKTEIVLSITPRIVGNINQPKAEVIEYWSGTETLITDKPQTNLPAAGSPTLSPQEQIRERMRLRQQQLNDETPLPVENPAPEPVSQPAPVNTDQSDAPANSESPAQ